MCGITCLFGEAHGLASLDPALLRPVLHHRGPDASGVHHDDAALLVHNRLAILDLSDDAAQPFHSERNVLLFNGEIYNFRELKRRYSDIPWKTQSDTEVILRLYERLGQAFVHELVGIFAFVLYTPATGRVFAVRDRLGVKPLYWHLRDGRLLLASEVKALAPHLPRVSLDRRVFRDFLVDGLLCHDDGTFFEDVRSLPAGCQLEYDLSTGACDVRPYWKLDPAPAPRPFDDALAEVSDRLVDAVRLNLVSDVEVAVSLSSGLDSTLLYALLGGQGQGRMRAFTFGYEHPDYDEIRRVEANDALGAANLTSTVLTPSRTLALLDEAIGFYETPLGGLGSLSAYHMMQTVGEQGIKVILAGEGADEVFGGYRYYLDHFLSGPEMRGPRAPDGTRLDAGHYATPALTAERLDAPANSGLEGGDALTRVMRSDLTSKKLPKLLHFQDRAAAAHGVECRVPYLDHRLVELLYSLPSDHKIRDGRTKVLAREVLERRFGIQLFQETKHYVATPQREWLKGPLYVPCCELLRDGALRASGLVDLERFFKDYDAYRTSKDLGNSFFVWKLVNLELLMRRWFG